MGISDIPKLFTDLLNEVGTSAILRERVLLIQAKAEALMEKVKELESKNADLEKENSKLAAQLKAKASQEDFVEHRGALFKRKPEGGYHLAVYCPSCHKSVGSIDAKMPFVCNCQWISGFKMRDLDSIIKELP